MMGLDELYEKIDSLNLISKKDDCNKCPKQCSRELEIHWLLPEEIDFFSVKGMEILEISQIKSKNKCYFFKAGTCKFFSDNDCKIYVNRPLECRLNPLSILKSNLILYKECKIYTNNKSGVMNISISLLEPLNRILKPWKKYFEMLGEIILLINPHIEEKIDNVGVLFND